MDNSFKDRLEATSINRIGSYDICYILPSEIPDLLGEDLKFLWDLYQQIYRVRMLQYKECLVKPQINYAQG